MSRPIVIKHQYFVHQGGAKDYNVVSIVNDDNHKGVVVRAWGKVGAKGQAKVSNIKTISAVEDDARGERKRRESKDYYLDEENRTAFDPAMTMTNVILDYLDGIRNGLSSVAVGAALQELVEPIGTVANEVVRDEHEHTANTHEPDRSNDSLWGAW